MSDTIESKVKSISAHLDEAMVLGNRIGRRAELFFEFIDDMLVMFPSDPRVLARARQLATDLKNL